MEATYGTTALVTMITPDAIYIANAGDCRASISRNHKIEALTKDHKPDNEIKRIVSAGYMVRDGRINGKLSVSRAIGDFAFKLNPLLLAEHQAVTALPEVFVVKGISRGNFILMACDGVWEC